MARAGQNLRGANTARQASSRVWFCWKNLPGFQFALSAMRVAELSVVINPSQRKSPRPWNVSPQYKILVQSHGARTSARKRLRTKKPVASAPPQRFRVKNAIVKKSPKYRMLNDVGVLRVRCPGTKARTPHMFQLTPVDRDRPKSSRPWEQNSERLFVSSHKIFWQRSLLQ